MGITLSSTTDTADQIKAAFGSSEAPAPETPPSAPSAETPPVAEATPPETPPEATPPAHGVPPLEESPVPPAADEKGTSAKLQARIDQLTRERHQSDRAREEAAAEATRLREELEAAKRAAEPPPAPPPAAQPAADPEPQEGDFEQYGEYIKAIGKWQVRQERAAILAEAEQKVEARIEAERQRGREAAQRRHEEQRARAHTARVDAFKAEHPDYAEVLEAAADVPISVDVEAVLKHSPDGPALIYHLARHPEEAQRLSALSRDGAIYEMGLLAHRLRGATAAPPVVEPPVVPPAPTPGVPVVAQPRQAPRRPAPPPSPGVAGATPPASPEKMNFKDFDRWREQGGGRRS
jgi:hypothetical protein